MMLPSNSATRTSCVPDTHGIHGSSQYRLRRKVVGWLASEYSSSAVHDSNVAVLREHRHLVRQLLVFYQIICI